MKKEKDMEMFAETVICDRQGYYHDAYYCRYCAGCPYAVDDIEGSPACYATQYTQCELNQA